MTGSDVTELLSAVRSTPTLEEPESFLEPLELLPEDLLFPCSLKDKSFFTAWGESAPNFVPWLTWRLWAPLLPPLAAAILILRCLWCSGAEEELVLLMAEGVGLEVRFRRIWKYLG